MPFQNKYEIYRNSLCMHITAVKTVEKFLFIAEGNQVFVYNLLSEKFVLSEVIFFSSSIHGIRSNGLSKIIFFGSKSLRIYSFDCSSIVCLKSCSDEITLFDWIFDVRWLVEKKETPSALAIITAHNCLTILNVGDKTLMKTVSCAENCILYAANIISALDNVIIAVGTVFQQVLIWSPNLIDNIHQPVKPLHCLEGHKGVIFSVTYSKYHKLLSSTSDDRSIRLWKVNSVSDDDSSLTFWEKADISASHVLYAHESRVWASAVLENCILSIGEDSCICFWSINGELLKKKKCHKGGSIWCLETYHLAENNCEYENFNSSFAITGGSDGGVYCWELKNILSKNLISQVSLHTRPQIEDFPRVVSIICCNESNKLMATTDKGFRKMIANYFDFKKIQWLSFYDMDMKMWQDTYFDMSFVSYCISAVSNNKSFIALGNLSGEIILMSSNDSYENSSLKKFKNHTGKIFALHWVNETSDYLLSCGTEGFMILWKVNFQDEKFDITKLSEFYLPKCKPHWWSTCALYVKSSSSLIVGDRRGSINFYLSESANNKISEPKMIHKCIHGDNGVTDIKEHKTLIYSAGRDGRVLLYSIKENFLHLLHAIKISHDLEWIGKMLFYGSDLLLLGFHTKYFIVWSTALESTVMSVECGGGHRSWDFHLTENGKATFTAIKKKDIIFCTEDLSFTLNKSIIKAGISGREFCEMCYLFTLDSNDSDSVAVFAAGGEDNTLRIIGIPDNETKSSQMIVLCSLSGHLSSIRSFVNINMVEKNSCLLVSVGGRAQMMLWKVKKDLNIECEQLASYILSSQEKKSRKSVKDDQVVQVDPQTRLMDVNIILNDKNSLSGENYIIALACSDSFFRVYNFDTAAKSLYLQYNVQLEEHCILKLGSIQSSETLSKSIFFITATTSGHLNFASHKELNSLTAVYGYSSEIKGFFHKPMFRVKLHQSGINALDLKQVTRDSWLICTGGDDNALSAIIVKVDSSLASCEIVGKAQINSAHSSQITGVRIIDDNTIISTSIDKRINLWKWYFEDNSFCVTLTASKMSLIPDIANLECWQARNAWTAAVCGEGIEIFLVKDLT